MAQISSAEAANETTGRSNRRILTGTIALVGVGLLAACATDQTSPPPPRYATPVLGQDPTVPKEKRQDVLLGFDDHYEADIHGADVHTAYRADGSIANQIAGPNTVEGVYKLLTGAGSVMYGGGVLAGSVMNGIAALRESNQPNVPQNVISLDNSSTSGATSNATANPQLTSILKSNPQLSAQLDSNTLSYLNNNPKMVTNLQNYLNQNQNYSPTNVVKALQMASQNNDQQQKNSPPPPPQNNNQGWYGSSLLPSEIRDPRVRDEAGRTVALMVFPENRRSGAVRRGAAAGPATPAVTG